MAWRLKTKRETLSDAFYVLVFQVMHQMQTNLPFSRGFCHEGMADGSSVSYMQSMTGFMHLNQDHGMKLCGKSGPVYFPAIPLVPVQESNYNNHAISNREKQVGFEEGRGRRVMETGKSIQPIDNGKRKRVDCMDKHTMRQDTHYTKSSNKSEQSRWTMRNPCGHARRSDSYLQQLFQTKGGYRVEGLGDTGDGEAKDSKPHSKQKIIKYLGQENFVKVQTTILRQVGTFKRQLHDLHRVVVVQREMVSTERERYQKSLQTPSPQTQTKHIAPNLSLQHDPMATWFASHYGLYPCADAIYGKGASIPWWQDASRVFGDPALAAANTRGAHKELSDKQATSHMTAQNQDNACKAVERNVQVGDSSAREKLKAPSLEGSSDWSDESSVGSGLLVDEKDSKKALQKDKVKDAKLCTIIPTAKPASPEMVAGILCALHR